MDDTRHVMRSDAAPGWSVPQPVARALAFMRANLDQAIALADLVSEAGVAERTLLKQFRQFVGASPLAHLRRLRLGAARTALLDPATDDSVASIAAQCGFAHFGRFSAEYRRAFGEFPSATRRRVRNVPYHLQAETGGQARSGRAAGVPLVEIAARRKPSLIVLPLRTETLAERLAARDLVETLAVGLSRIGVASVVLAHHDRALPRPGVGRPRNEYCLLGRLAQRDGRVRATIRLIDAATDRHVWGDCYDGDVADMFALQDRVAEAVPHAVAATLLHTEVQRLRDRDPASLTARELAIRAYPMAMRTDAAGARQAIELTGRAMEADPDDAVPVALAAYAQVRLSYSLDAEAPAQALARARQLAQQALMLDANDVMVVSACASVATLMGRNGEADWLAARATAMDPTSGWAWERRAHQRLNAGENSDRVIADFQRAMVLHGAFMPRENCLLGIAQANCAAGRPAEAVRVLRSAIVENPRAAWLYRMIASIEHCVGNRSEARQAVEQLRRAHPHVTVRHVAESSPMLSGDHLLHLAQSGLPD
ncbi:MAG: helix-turn-helix domain-containing protein [Proteobacteria bacterium]|nr:helix-turn-helix domain-containing protein [Pseudomonadota bacterium]